MRKLQEKSAFVPHFYGIFVQRGGGDGPETRRAGGMSDGVILCTYNRTMSGLRAGHHTPRVGGAGWPRRARGTGAPPAAVARTAVLLPFPGERGGAGAAGGTIASSSVASSTSPGRRAPAWNAGGGEAADGPLGAARCRHDARRHKPVIRSLDARAAERVLPCRVLPAEATGQPGCHLSVGVPGGPDGRHHSPRWRTRPARCRPMRAGARCDRRCLGAMGGDHHGPRRDCEPGTIALRRYSDVALAVGWIGRIGRKLRIGTSAVGCVVDRAGLGKGGGLLYFASLVAPASQIAGNLPGNIPPHVIAS